MSENINSVLSMNKLVFDKIDFERIGAKDNNTNFSFEMEVVIAQSSKLKRYKVTLKLTGRKDNEYDLNISLSGFFSFKTSEMSAKDNNDDYKEEIIGKNAVAIMMPYLRSQVSLITAQPDVDCVVLPPFNINNMLSDNQTDTK